MQEDGQIIGCVWVHTYSPQTPAEKRKKSVLNDPVALRTGSCPLAAGRINPRALLFTWQLLLPHSWGPRWSPSSLSHSCFDLFDDLYHRFGRWQQGTVIVTPEAAGAGVPVCAQLVFFLLALVLAGLQVVQPQRVNARVFGAGWRWAVVHFGAFDLVQRRRAILFLLRPLDRLRGWRSSGLLSCRCGLRWGLSSGGIWQVLGFRESRGRKGRRLRQLWQGRRRTLHVAHLSVNALHNVVVHKQIRNDAVLGGLQVRRGLETGGELQEALGQRNGQVYGVTVFRPCRWNSSAGQLAHVGHGLVHILAWIGERKKQTNKKVSD